MDRTRDWTPRWPRFEELAERLRFHRGRKVVVLLPGEDPLLRYEPMLHELRKRRDERDRGAAGDSPGGAIRTLNAVNATIYPVAITRRIRRPDLRDESSMGFFGRSGRTAELAREMVGGFPPYGALAAGTSYRGDIGFPGNLAEIGDRNRVWYQLAWSPDPRARRADSWRCGFAGGTTSKS